MISNALTLGLFPKSTPGRDLLDFSLEPGSLMSGCWVECRKCCRNFLMDYHLRLFWGVLSNTLGRFLFTPIRMCELWLLTHISLWKFKTTTLLFETFEMKGCVFFAAASKDLIQFLKADLFFRKMGY